MIHMNKFHGIEIILATIQKKPNLRLAAVLLPLLLLASCLTTNPGTPGSSIGCNAGHWFDLPRGSAANISFKAHSNYGFDLLIVTEEGLASYRFFLKNGSGQLTSYRRELCVTTATFRWNPPNGRQYYLILDNSRFPQDGNGPVGGTTTYDLTITK